MCSYCGCMNAPDGEYCFTDDDHHPLPRNRTKKSICEDCGKKCKRRTQCIHCGLYVCTKCFYPKHSCMPSHSFKTCEDHKKYKNMGNRILID